MPDLGIFRPLKILCSELGTRPKLLLYEKIFLLKIIAIHHQIMRILIAIVNTQLVQFKQHQLVGCRLRCPIDAKARDLKGKSS